MLRWLTFIKSGESKGSVFDGSRATKILGIEYIRDMRLVDMGVSMIAGCIEDKSIPW